MGASASQTGLSQAEPEVSALRASIPSAGGWIPYSERRPDREGVFEWRVPSRRVAGLTVQFFAHMRERGAGYSRAVSPSFDHWDGYRLTVPEGTLWREGVDPPAIKSYQTTDPVIPDAEVAPCPYCSRVPVLKGIERAGGGGFFVGSDPERYNSWWLECCAWARTPHLKDPRELIAKRNAVLASAIEARRAETPKSDSVEDESAIPQGDAQ
jgi:hypothetical protein